MSRDPYASLLQNIRGCWSPSLGPSGRLVIDRSGYNRHARFDMLSPAPSPPAMTVENWRASEAGWSLDLIPGDGTGNRLWEANVPPTEFSEALTVVQWCKLRTGGSNARRLNITYWATFNQTSTPFLQFYNNNNQTIAYYFNGNPYGDFSFGANWGLIAATWSQNDFRLYVNGNQVDSKSLNQSYQNLANTRLYWGEAGVAIDASWGECAVWNRKLSQAEILQIYINGNGYLGKQLSQPKTRFIAKEKKTGLRRLLLTGQT